MVKYSQKYSRIEYGLNTLLKIWIPKVVCDIKYSTQVLSTKSMTSNTLLKFWVLKVWLFKTTSIIIIELLYSTDPWRWILLSTLFFRRSPRLSGLARYSTWCLWNTCERHGVFTGKLPWVLRNRLNFLDLPEKRWSLDVEQKSNRFILGE